jgi:inhibitor of KinA sporulation pathway (predicted exonuclease)
MSKYVVFDLEMCFVPKSVKRSVYNCRNELIQIGAVVVDEDLKITDKFMTYVSPTFGKVDAYIENLTGITKQNTNKAPKVKEALEMFFNWMPDDAVLVSWSDNDEYQIRKETEAKGIVIDGLEEHLANWIDCQKTFSQKMNNERNYKLSEALILADIDYDEGEHDALVDAKNTAQLFIKMERESELTLNPYFTTHEEKLTYNPFAEFFAKHSLAC